MFFSFPHIAIDSDGKVGAIARPNRPGASAACGALIKTMLDLKEEGIDTNVSAPGSHDPLEPEYSILKSRIARRIKYEKGDVSEMSLVDITKVAERVITTVSNRGQVGWGTLLLLRGVGFCCLVCIINGARSCQHSSAHNEMRTQPAAFLVHSLHSALSTAVQHKVGGAQCHAQLLCITANLAQDRA